MIKVTRRCPNGVKTADPQYLFFTGKISAIIQVWKWIRVGYNVDVTVDHKE